jgi:hypothetical protein
MIVVRTWGPTLCLATEDTWIMCPPLFPLHVRQRGGNPVERLSAFFPKANFPSA